MESKDNYTQLPNENESENESEETKQFTIENKHDTNNKIELQTLTTKETTETATNTNEIPYEYKDVPLDSFEVLTTDISFRTKFRLLLWKNATIQCIRYPKGLCLTYGIPIIVMIILVC
eukprot:42101_1